MVKKSGFNSNGISIAVVKDNRDVDRTGILKVSISGQASDTERESNWTSVKYASPFWGVTPDNPKSTNFEDTKKSYGMWFVPPDIGNRVLICFVDGDPTRGYWFACVPEGTVNHMVPGIGSDINLDGDQTPVAEYNNIGQTVKIDERPVHEPLYQGLLNQGLENDLLRGPSSSSAKREAPSRSYGILTPRGHQIVFDDGWRNEELPWHQSKNTTGLRSMVDPQGERGERRTDFKEFPNPANQKSNTKGSQDLVNPFGRNDEFIRFRTRSGAQLLISETHGHIYAISRDGNTWIELNNDGHIDIYGGDSISIRSEGDINLRADNNVNIEAGNDINVKAETGNINVESKKDTDWTTGGDHKLNVIGTLDQKSGKDTNQEAGGNFNNKAATTMSNEAGAAINLLAGGDLIETGANIHLNGPKAGAASAATEATTTETNSFNELVSGLRPALTHTGADLTVVTQQETTDSIVSRRPHHEPWAGRTADNPANFRDKK